MKIISAKKITQAVGKLCIQSNTVLRPDVLVALKNAYKKEINKRAKNILDITIKNAQIAKKEKLAICQDTGMPVVFVELGQDVKITGGSLGGAIKKGIELGYKKGSLRNSIVKDPLKRGKSGFSPGIIHIDLVKGSKIKLTVLPKGFGCENKTQSMMFNPTVDLAEIKKFILKVVKDAGADACPPYILGIGIGGTQDYASFLAKKALLRKVISHQLSAISHKAKLERELLKEINKLNIGPMGLGGKSTCLGVNIETYPTHIAGLPVCVNISCHALRSAAAVI